MQQWSMIFFFCLIAGTTFGQFEKLGVKADKNGNHYIVKYGGNGEKIEALGTWKSIDFISFTDFARVEDLEGNKFLLDIEGNTYKVAYSIEELTPDTKALDLRQIASFRQLRLDSIPNEVFKHKQLELLLLSYSGIHKISHRIGELKKLKVFDLKSVYNESDELFEIPKEFGQLENLEILNLAYHKLEHLPPSIGNLSKLKQLRLNDNSLKDLSFDFSQMQQLEVLNLSDNKLKKLPQSLGEAKSLKELDLSDNQLKVLPESIGELQQLQILSIESNPIQQLPKNFRQLSALEILYAGGCKLSKLPEALTELKNLKQLNLAENGIETLPKHFGNLKSLEALNLVDNKLKKLPQSFEYLKKLEGVALGHNQIQEFPTTLLNLPNLKRLNLNKNNLQSIPEDISKLKKIESLAIGYNESINKLPMSITQCKNLNYIDIRQTAIDKEELKWLTEELPNCYID
jgi:leucine-rich repeat protein SHOC2